MWESKFEGEIFGKEHLDHFFAKIDWRRMFPTSQVNNLGFFRLDHHPIQLFLGRSSVRVRRNGVKKGGGGFHFE